MSMGSRYVTLACPGLENAVESRCLGSSVCDSLQPASFMALVDRRNSKEKAVLLTIHSTPRRITRTG